MLGIYELADPSSAYSVSGIFTNPLSHTFDGVTGGIVEQKYYVRNDDAAVTYSGITLQAVDTGGFGLVDSNGYEWKLSAGNDQPLEQEWDSLAAGNTISLAYDGAGDISTYLPFWLRIKVPRGVTVQSFDSVVLRLEATETTP
jgi:hypothetical protein